MNDYNSIACVSTKELQHSFYLAHGAYMYYSLSMIQNDKNKKTSIERYDNCNHEKYSYSAETFKNILKYLLQL